MRMVNNAHSPLLRGVSRYHSPTNLISAPTSLKNNKKNPLKPANPISQKMELLYLVGSIIWNSLISCTLSLLLPFQILLRQGLSCLSSSWDGDGEGLTLYEGIVWHQRRRPIQHSFEYKVRYALIDLDRSSHLLSSNHLSADEARKVAGTTGTV